MKVINILENENYLDEYIILCNDEWGNSTVDVESKKKKILSGDKVMDYLQAYLILDLYHYLSMMVMKEEIFVLGMPLCMLKINIEV